MYNSDLNLGFSQHQNFTFAFSLTNSPDDFYTFVQLDGPDKKQIDKERRCKQKNEHKARVKQHQLNEAPLPGPDPTLDNLLCLCLYHRRRPGRTAILLQIQAAPRLPAALGGEFLKGTGLYAISFKLDIKPPILTVNPVEFVTAHMDHPAHINDATNRIDDFPVVEYFFHKNFRLISQQRSAISVQ